MRLSIGNFPLIICFDNIKLTVSFQVYFLATARAPCSLLVWIKQEVVAPNFWESSIWHHLSMGFGISSSIISDLDQTLESRDSQNPGDMCRSHQCTFYWCIWKDSLWKWCVTNATAPATFPIAGVKWLLIEQEQLHTF